METIFPKIGVPGILQKGEKPRVASKVTLHIIDERGVMVEKRTEEGSEPTIIVKFITPSTEADE